MWMRFALLRAGMLGCVVLALSRCSSDKPLRSGLSAGCLVNSDCNDPLQCSFGLCHKACKESRDCPAQQHCLNLPSGPVCQLDQDTVECVYSSQCHEPLKCAVDSRCRVPCVGKDDCLPSQVCTQHVCADKDELNAGTQQLPVTNDHAWTGSDAGPGESMDAGSGGSSHSSGGAGNQQGGAGGAGGAEGKGGAAGASGAGSGGKGTIDKDAGQIDSGSSVGPPTCGDAGVRGFHPSNIPAQTAIPGGLIDLDNFRNWFDTGNAAPNPTAPAWDTTYTTASTQQTVVKLADGREAAVLWVASLSMPQGSNLVIKGSRPLIIVSTGPVDINGSIYADADPLRGWFAGGAAATTTLARAGTCPIDTVAGGGRAGLSDETKGIGPGGGGFCGKGGPGSTDLMGSPAPAGGVSYGTQNLIPLVGGSAGGSSGGTGGHGGGAIQIVSGVGIVVGETGVINMAGGGADVYGGGGSGGAILLEAPSVTIRGVLASNGGSGGDAYRGADGPASSEPAASRDKAGPGAAGDNANGEQGNAAGTALDTAGGGGGVGRIRINTGCGGMLVVSSTAIISPSENTKCYTAGELR